MKTAATFLLAAGLALAAAPVQAQMPESYREVQLSALRLQRRVLLTMADSMPERLYRDKATPTQRDFAEQVQHTAGALSFVINRVFRTGTNPARTDSLAALNTRAGLKAFVNSQFDWAEGVFRGQTAEARNAQVNLFGSQMPGWQVWDEMHQHAFWTAGQIVANFRKHGMAPPGFGFF